jgi:hypothetical protein
LVLGHGPQGFEVQLGGRIEREEEEEEEGKGGRKEKEERKGNGRKEGGE